MKRASKPRSVKVKRTWVAKGVSDGEVLQSPPITHDELALRWLQTASILYCSQNAASREIGADRLKMVSKIMAQHEEAMWDRQRAAALGRTKNPLRTKILELMTSYSGSEFKTFLAAWEQEPLDGLRLTLDKAGGRWLVEDENSESSDANGYTLGSLDTMFSEAKRGKTER